MTGSWKRIVGDEWNGPTVWGFGSWLCPKFCPDMMRDVVKPVLDGQVVSSDMVRPVKVNRTGSTSDLPFVVRFSVFFQGFSVFDFQNYFSFLP